MKFCSTCGHAVCLRTPPGDNRERYVCAHCGAVHYENPRNVVGALCIWEEKVLLCRRAIEPRHGYWTLPGGFMETGETTAEAATRETLEEAGARIEVQSLFALLNVPHIAQVHLFYLARLLDPDVLPGDESLEARLFVERDIPWDDIAFPTVSRTLRFFFADRQAGHYGMHTGDVRRGASSLHSAHSSSSSAGSPCAHPTHPPLQRG